MYLLLARLRGCTCELWVPENVGVCIYMKSLGLFKVLQEKGVKVDDRNIGERHDQQLIIPLTHFETLDQVDDLTNKAYEALDQTGAGGANLYPLVSETFGELAMNAAEHAESPIGAYGFIQFYESGNGPRFVCCVADGGIGIRKSLERNPELRDRVPYDWSAIELALRERVTGTGGKTRGFGLYTVADDMRKPGRQLVIGSGIGALRIDEDMQSKSWRTRLFPGTLTFASISI